MSEARYGAAADRAADAAGVPRPLFRRLIAAESGWNPAARSSAGAIGLGQLMPGTARALGVNPTDPAQNLTGAARYLRQQFDSFGRWDLALAAYNAGPGKAREARGTYSKSYVDKIMDGLSPTATVSSGRPSSGGFVLPLPTPLPTTSSYSTADGPEGVPTGNGGHIHGGMDWFAPAGTAVRAPTAGRVIEVKPSSGSAGQVFGGVVKVEDSTGRVFVFRHVDPAVREGATVRPGATLARVTRWADNPKSSHAHVEVWKSSGGGYTASNLIDPKSVFSGGGFFAPGGPGDMLQGTDNDLAGAIDGAVDALNPLAWVESLTGWVLEHAALALAYVLVGALAVWLLGTGSNRAFGTPAPSSVLAATPVGRIAGA